MKRNTTKLVREMVGGEPYEYYPLGNHIVAAPGVCGGDRRSRTRVWKPPLYLICWQQAGRLSKWCTHMLGVA